MVFPKTLMLSGFGAFALFVVFAYVPLIYPTKLPPFSWSSSIAPEKTFRAPKRNVWADLSQVEAEEVTKFVFSKADLNLTDAATASP